MKINIQKNLIIAATLDSSETTMFNQGGKHEVEMKEVLGNVEDYDSIKITFQLERDEQGRFDFINSSAAQHRKQWDNINGEPKPE